LDRGKKKEMMDPIMMDEEHIKDIMEKEGMMQRRRPYQYNINRKKRAVAEREGLESDEEEVEDLCAIEKIEEILCAKYDRKKKRSGVPSQILQKCWKQANLVEVDAKGAVGGLVVL
jgi:hypothetical protein